MPASIFNKGDAVKILKDLLRFKSDKEVITNISNAQISAGITSPVGSYAITTEGQGYFKYGSNDTDWNPIILSIGISGGQSITGGSAAGENLTLESTSNGTKGRILAQSPINFLSSMSSPTYAEGNVSWNTAQKTLDIQTGMDDTVLQVGQEIYVYVCNNTGSQIDNGKPVYISGVDGGCPTIGLSQANIEEKSRSLGIATMDIPDTENGFITAFGLVRDIDTSGLSTGRVYLGTTNGELTNSRPSDGSYANEIGTCLVSDASNGVIFVNPILNELTVEVTDTNGFPDDQRTGTTLSFVDGTRTFTIAPTGSSFHFYELGNKYEKTSSESIIISTDEGMNAIYYDNGVLTTLLNPTDTQFEHIILNHAIVALVYWDATNSSGIYIGDERHGISMSPKTHAYLHITRGAQYGSGLALGDILAGENGSLDSHAQFSTTSGVIYDEDISHSLPTVASTVGLPIYALSGSTPNLRKYSEAGFSVLTDVTAGIGATGRLVFNEFTGGAWQLTVVNNLDFVLCHIFAINGVSGGDQWVAIMGQNQYASTALARAGAEVEINSIVSILPLPEIVSIGTVIFQTSNSYANSVKAKIITTDLGEDYVDWRKTEITGGTAPSDHNNLSGLQLANTGVTYGHIDDQAQSIYGVKSFLAQAILSAGFDCQGIPILDQENNSTATGSDATLTKPTKAIVRLTNASLSSIDDIADGDNEQLVILTNDTGSDITINNGATKIITGTGSNLTLSDDASIILYFDSSSTWRVVGGSGGSSAPKSNITTSSPTSSNDETEGYEIFSPWLDTSKTPKRIYMCVDASTGSAEWIGISNETIFYDIIQEYTARSSLGSSGQQEAGHAFGTSDPETVTGDVLAVYHFADTGNAFTDDEKGTYDLSITGTVSQVGGIFGGSAGGADMATGAYNYLTSATLWDSAVTNAYTLEIWFETDSTSTFWLWGKVFSANPNDDNLKCSISSGDVNWFKTVGGSQVQAASSGTAFPNGTINHAIFTLDSTNGMRIFANGNTTPVGTNASTTIPTAGSAFDFSLGQLNGDSNTSLNLDGKIYYVRVTDKVVDDAFVKMSYATKYTWNQSYAPSSATITFKERDSGTGSPVETDFSTISAGSDSNFIYRLGGIYDNATDLIRIESIEN